MNYIDILFLLNIGLFFDIKLIKITLNHFYNSYIHLTIQVL